MLHSQHIQKEEEVRKLSARVHLSWIQLTIKSIPGSPKRDHPSHHIQRCILPRRHQRRDMHPQYHIRPTQRQRTKEQNRKPQKDRDNKQNRPQDTRPGANNQKNTKTPYHNRKDQQKQPRRRSQKKIKHIDMGVPPETGQQPTKIKTNLETTKQDPVSKRNKRRPPQDTQKLPRSNQRNQCRGMEKGDEKQNKQLEETRSI